MKLEMLEAAEPEKESEEDEEDSEDSEEEEHVTCEFFSEETGASKNMQTGSETERTVKRFVCRLSVTL